jgi:Ca2+-binding EF-hand superfamily protein
LTKCKDTLKEALQLEDYEEEGLISISVFKSVVRDLNIEGVDDQLIDFLAL